MNRAMPYPHPPKLRVIVPVKQGLRGGQDVLAHGIIFALNVDGNDFVAYLLYPSGECYGATEQVAVSATVRWTGLIWAYLPSGSPTKVWSVVENVT